MRFFLSLGGPKMTEIEAMGPEQAMHLVDLLVLVDLGRFRRDLMDLAVLVGF